MRPHMNARYARRFASFCHWSPGILCNGDPPRATSSWLIGSRKLSVKRGVNHAEGDLVVVGYVRAVHGLPPCTRGCRTSSPYSTSGRSRGPEPPVGLAPPAMRSHLGAIITMPGLRLMAVAFTSAGS
jgi:hypothetical protein